MRAVRKRWKQALVVIGVLLAIAAVVKFVAEPGATDDLHSEAVYYYCYGDGTHSDAQLKGCLNHVSYPDVVREAQRGSPGAQCVLAGIGVAPWNGTVDSCLPEVDQ